MKNDKFHTRPQSLNEAFSEQKSQISTPSDDEFLSDEELAAVSGGRGSINIDVGDIIRASTEAAGAVAGAAESLGRTIGRTFWNGDRC